MNEAWRNECVKRKKRSSCTHTHALRARKTDARPRHIRRCCCVGDRPIYGHCFHFPVIPSLSASTPFFLIDSCSLIEAYIVSHIAHDVLFRSISLNSPRQGWFIDASQFPKEAGLQSSTVTRSTKLEAFHSLSLLSRSQVFNFVFGEVSVAMATQLAAFL